MIEDITKQHDTATLLQARRVPCGAYIQSDKRSPIRLVAFHPAHHFPLVAVIRCEKVPAHEEQNDAGGLEMLIDLTGEFFASADLAVTPCVDDALSLQNNGWTSS